MINAWKRKLIIVSFMILITALFTGCGKNYKHLEMAEAEQMIKSEKDAIILDVRTQEEYDKKHIPGALLLPIDEIRNGNVSALPNKNQKILIYCWTGRRAEDSAAMLVDMGYKNVYEFGGLVNWTGELEGYEVDKSNNK